MADPTTTGWTTIQIVSLVGGSSVIAAIVTQGVVWLREWLGENKEGKFAALYIANALEEYAGVCAGVISESLNFDASSGHAGATHGNIPALPEYPAVNWKSLGIKRAETAMGFRTRVDSRREYFSGLWEFADEEDVSPEVREDAARLSLEALAIGEKLRRDHRLQRLNEPGSFSTKAWLTEKHAEFVAKRLAWEKRNRESMDELWNTGEK